MLFMVFAMVFPSCEKEVPGLNENWFVGEYWIDPRDGRSYATVQIGDQVWMAENQAYEGAGTQISDDVDWMESSQCEGWCYYGDNQSKYGSTYGILYQWEVAKEVCPSGWHLPDDEEWTQLTDYLGGESVAGGKMKDPGTIHWIEPNTVASQSVGFHALPGGRRAYYGSNFGFISYSAYFWSSTETDSSHAIYRRLHHNSPAVFRDKNLKESGFSVRCVKDEE
jgi:uncharacterized protein (TIGR02145 family)